MMDKIAEQQVTKKVKSKVWMIGIVSLVLLLVEMITPLTASGWNGGAHRFIASQGILILKNDYPVDVEYLYDPVYINGKSTNGANLIMYYATEPDDNPLENDGGVRIGGFRGHFYDPSTGLNYMGERDPTANTRLSWHYGNAVKAYKAGDQGKAWAELGRAIHYLGDLNAPHHAANMPNFDPKVYWTPAHTYFEHWVDFHTNDFAIGTAPLETYDYAINNNVWQIGHDMAIGAKQVVFYVDSMDKVQNGGQPNTLNLTMAARPTLQRAQRITAGILHKFLADVNYGF